MSPYYNIGPGLTIYFNGDRTFNDALQHKLHRLSDFIHNEIKVLKLRTVYYGKFAIIKTNF